MTAPELFNAPFNQRKSPICMTGKGHFYKIKLANGHNGEKTKGTSTSPDVNLNIIILHRKTDDAPLIRI